MKLTKLLQVLYENHYSKMINGSSTRSIEYDIVKSKIDTEHWKMMNPQSRQENRVLFFKNLPYEKSPMLYIYYEYLIKVYELSIDLLTKLDDLLNDVNLIEVDIRLLRLYAFVSIEKQNIDESILPNTHVYYVIITNIIKGLNADYPELKLLEFLETYSMMYKTWPWMHDLSYENDPNIDKWITLLNTLINEYSRDVEYPVEIIEEYSLICYKSSRETWRMLDSFRKQDRRRQNWIRFKHYPELLTNNLYYENMIKSYDKIMHILDIVKNDLKDEYAIKNAELGLLRICAILQIEKDYMDEDIIPTHHIHPRFIENLAREYHETYPDLRLTELSQAYTEMYELWPEKPDQNQ